MFDAAARRALAPALGRAAAALDRPGISPDALTGLGLALGLASAAAAAAQLWVTALVAWWGCRLLDGLDGALARRRGARDAGAGGFLDIVADFTVYGVTVVGVAVGATRGQDAPWWPFLLVLLAYYLNGATFLAFSSLAERSGRRIDDGRSLSFLGGLTEGAETVVVHSLWLLVPAAAASIAVGWAALVGVSALGRAWAGYVALR